MNWMDEGGVWHVLRGKGFAYKVGNPISELVMMIHDEAALLTIQFVAYEECSIAYIAAVSEFINNIIPLFLTHSIGKMGT